MPLPEMFWDEPLATNEAVAGFLDHLETVMEQSGFLNPEQPQVPARMTRMRRLFMRCPTRQNGNEHFAGCAGGAGEKMKEGDARANADRVGVIHKDSGPGRGSYV